MINSAGGISLPFAAGLCAFAERYYAKGARASDGDSEEERERGQRQGQRDREKSVRGQERDGVMYIATSRARNHGHERQVWLREAAREVVTSLCIQMCGRLSGWVGVWV